MSKMTHKNITKTALAFSVCLFALWIVLGTNATLAWFSDTTETARNTFVLGEMDLDVSYRTPQDSNYAPMYEDTNVFNDQALYEPGYTEVVYLKIENKGNVDFDYKLSVKALDGYTTTSTNKQGKAFSLPPYLRFGVVFGSSEAALDRQLAQDLANHNMLNAFSEVDPVPVAEGEERYAAIVLYMPETVGNEANYQKGAEVPRVKLGITVRAQQAGASLT